MNRTMGGTPAAAVAASCLSSLVVAATTPRPPAPTHARRVHTCGACHRPWRRRQLPTGHRSGQLRRCDRQPVSAVPARHELDLRGRGRRADRRTEVVVTEERRNIQGISATVVRDTVHVAGELVEDTYDWYAQDATGTSGTSAGLHVVRGGRDDQQGGLLGLRRGRRPARHRHARPTRRPATATATSSTRTRPRTSVRCSASARLRRSPSASTPTSW